MNKLHGTQAQLKSRFVQDAVAPLIFKKLELSDRQVLEAFLNRFPKCISGFTFPALFPWSAAYQYEWSMFENTCFISCVPEGDGRRHYLQPVGDFGPAAQAAFLAEISRAEYPVKIFGVSEYFVHLHADFVSKFEVVNDRDLANYLYKTEDLAHLAGKFYAKKRNLIAQASKLYQYDVEPIIEKNYKDCLTVLQDIEADEHMTAASERLALAQAIEHFPEIGGQGLLIKVDGHPVAFSIYEQESTNTAIIHFEKAEKRFKGLYQVINQETAKAILAQGIPFINREEDMGIEGMRQAKLSYGPVQIIPAITLVRH